MAIYIKGMEMPKGCYDCPLLDGEYGYCKVGATGLYDPYRDDCPLTEVPEPHGRLIDADRLKKVFGRNVASAEAFDCIFDNAPTVIERSDK